MVTIARCHTVVAASAVPRERDIALSLVWNVTRKVSATCPVRFVHTSLQTWRRTECGGGGIDGLRVLATKARERRGKKEKTVLPARPLPSSPPLCWVFPPVP